MCPTLSHFDLLNFLTTLETSLAFSPIDLVGLLKSSWGSKLVAVGADPRTPLPDWLGLKHQ